MLASEGIGLFGFGDTASDYVAYEAQLASAWAAGPAAISAFESNPANVPASIAGGQPVYPSVDCSPVSCPTGPYGSNASANYSYWQNKLQSIWGQMIPANAIKSNQESSLPLMSYNDLLAGHLVTCDPRDSACVAQNTANQAAVEKYWVDHNGVVPVGTVLSLPTLTEAQIQQFYSPITGQGGNVVAAIAPGVSVVANSPLQQILGGGGNNPTSQGESWNLQFSRPGNVFYPGDSWTLTIRNAIPKSPVIVRGSFKNSSGTTILNGIEGTTDSGGNFTMSATINSSHIGQWSEDWYINSTLKQHIDFVVQAQTQTTSAPPANVPPSQNVPPTGQQQVTNTTAFKLFGNEPTITLPVVGSVGEYTALVAALGIAFVISMMASGSGRKYPGVYS